MLILHADYFALCKLNAILLYFASNIVTSLNVRQLFLFLIHCVIISRARNTGVKIERKFVVLCCKGCNFGIILFSDSQQRGEIRERRQTFKMQLSKEQKHANHAQNMILFLLYKLLCSHSLPFSFS